MSADEFPSPDGLYTVLISSNEIRMSHWIDTPALQDTRTKAILLNFHGTLWSADTVTWAEDSQRVQLDLRLYPGTRAPATLWVWPALGVAHVAHGTSSEERRAILGDRVSEREFDAEGTRFEGSISQVREHLEGLQTY